VGLAGPVPAPDSLYIPSVIRQKLCNFHV